MSGTRHTRDDDGRCSMCGDSYPCGIALTELLQKKHEPTYTLAQVKDEKRKLVDEIAANVKEYFASGEAIDNCADEKELENYTYIVEITEFIRERTEI